MKRLQTNEIKNVAGGLEGELTAEFCYETPWGGSDPYIMYYTSITGPADQVLSQIASGNYPKYVEGFEALKIDSIFIAPSDSPFFS